MDYQIKDFVQHLDFGSKNVSSRRVYKRLLRLGNERINEKQDHPKNNQNLTFLINDSLSA